jgi:hypothetical protein
MFHTKRLAKKPHMYRIERNLFENSHKPIENSHTHEPSPGPISLLSALTLRGVPQDAKTVGTLGLIPFIMTAIGPHVPLLSHLFPPDVTQTLQIGYGAVILSFLGASHWGLEMAGYGGNIPRTRFWLSVLPALIAWTSFSFPYAGALAVQIVGFNFAFLGDVFAVRDGRAPRWWLGLRAWLTAVVTASLYYSMPESERSKERKRLAIEAEHAKKTKAIKDEETKREDAVREAEQKHKDAILAARKAGEEKARLEALESGKIEEERALAALREREKLDTARRVIAEKTGKVPPSNDPINPLPLAAAIVVTHKEPHEESLFEKAKHMAQDAVDTIKQITHTDEISNKFDEVERSFANSKLQPTDVEVGQQLADAQSSFEKDKEAWFEAREKETRHTRALEEMKRNEEEAKSRVEALERKVAEEEEKLKQVALKTLEEKEHLKNLEVMKKTEDAEKARIAALAKQVAEEEEKLKHVSQKAAEEKERLHALELVKKQEEAEKARFTALSKQVAEEEAKLKAVRDRTREEELKIQEMLKKEEAKVKEIVAKQQEVEKSRLEKLKQQALDEEKRLKTIEEERKAHLAKLDAEIARREADARREAEERFKKLEEVSKAKHTALKEEQKKLEELVAEERRRISELTHTQAQEQEKVGYLLID